KRTCRAAVESQRPLRGQGHHVGSRLRQERVTSFESAARPLRRIGDFEGALRAYTSIPKPQLRFSRRKPMTADKTNSRISRRAALQAGLAMAAAPLLQFASGSAFAQAAAPARKATKVLDFMTGADVAKAEQEGQIVFYTHDSEPAGAAIIEAFTKDF